MKAPTVSVHAALVSQLWDPAAIEGRGASALQSRPSVLGSFSIRARQRKVLEVPGAGQLTTVGPRDPQTASLPSHENYRSRHRILKDPRNDGSPINLSAKRAASNEELGRGRGMTFAFVDVCAGNPSAVVARVARAFEGAGKVGARRVRVAVVGPICNGGARPVSSSVTPERGRAI